MGTEHVGRPRRRDAAATRQSLLDAARVLMAERGVEGTSTRDVATAAGVNQALVYRYFGSKEKLFAEAASGGDSDNIIRDTPLAELPHTLLGHALDLTAAGTGGGAAISRFVGAANDDTVRAILRERIDSAFGDLLADRLDGPDTALRAELLAAIIVGVSFLRDKIGTTALSSVDRATLGAYVDRLAAPLLATDQVPEDFSPVT
ncbi:TetR/AcrR family transcriptional regulator [Nocardia pseudovaccinii]|uniref:TetR/AcrR family transcriptional regulator n=1 Tax=Nocardia pseudovaccinii TaxID=189540 RepID=UPI0007A3E145|nr:TetR/AcrR family transcriptional regulator [Nocardia pseudovaccinii]